MQTNRVCFPGSLGFELVGRLDGPAGSPRAAVVCAPCFTCSKDLKGTRRIARALTTAGVAALRFDYTGLHESRGDFEITNFTSMVRDIECAALWLRLQHDVPLLLFGHSLGGAAAIVAAQRIANVAAIALVNATSHTRRLSDAIRRQRPETAQSIAVQMSFMGGRDVTITPQFLADLDAQNMDDAIRRLPCPLLLFQGTADELLGMDHAERIFAAAPYPKSFVALDGADHLLVRHPHGADYVGEVLRVWLESHVFRSLEDETGSGRRH